MNIIHIFGITILLMDGTHSAIEEQKSITQSTLLRKLQSYKYNETKPLTWNEVLADVFVNKISIFAFKKPDSESDAVSEALIAKEKSAFTNFISQVFVIYKKFIYDVFIETPHKNIDESDSIETVHLYPEIEKRNVDSDEVVNNSFGVISTDGPKGEVELVEPRYHGKQIAVGKGAEENGEENVNDCPEGSVKFEGNCVANSRLLMAIPGQCPIGYRRDRLGFCRMRF